jgi:hypothetical protein
MTLKEFERTFARKVKRERSHWAIVGGVSTLRLVTEGLDIAHCPLTYLAQDASADVGTCGERLGLRPATARRIADAADDSDSSDGLRTRLLRAAGVVTRAATEPR